MRVLRFRSEHLRDHQFLGDLTDWGMVGLIEEDGSVRVFFDHNGDLDELVTRYGGLLENPESSVMPADVAAEPIPLGTRFAVVSSPDESLEGRESIYLPGSEAFGSGRHETTQMVADALEELDLTGTTVLDVGSGSGIISEVARRLGANSVFGCDTHPGSLSVSARQFPSVPLFCGSADSVASEAADVVIANITAAVVDRLADELVRVTKPDGVLLLSGFIFESVPTRFTPERVLGNGDWLCWVCRRESLLHLGQETAPIQPFPDQWW